MQAFGFHGPFAICAALSGVVVVLVPKIKVAMDATVPLEIVAIHRFKATSAWRFLPAINPMDPPHAKARRGIREGSDERKPRLRPTG